MFNKDSRARLLILSLVLFYSHLFGMSFLGGNVENGYENTERDTIIISVFMIG